MPGCGQPRWSGRQNRLLVLAKRTLPVQAAHALLMLAAGVLLALGLLSLFLSWRRRLPLWALLAAALLAACWLVVKLQWLWAATLLAAAALAGAMWLLHRHVRSLHAARQRAEQAQQRAAAARAAVDTAQAQLHQAQASAEAADQAKARFLAAASHDLRQPAHALGLYMAALRAGPLAPAQAEIAERMQGSLAALDTLFAALLDVSRIDAGAVVPQWDTVALAPLLRRLADEWALQAESRGLRLALHVSEPDALTVTDALLLERVLRNLLANAVKYTERGGVLLACRSRSSADGTRQHRIELWDSGPGIAAAEQERIFEEFYQASGRERSAGPGPGLGLGLAIVQRLAKLLQLRVQLHSRPGRGTVFFVEGLAPAGVAPQAAASARHQMRRLNGTLVAILEDDAQVCDAMRRLLQRWDCRVVDGASAAELLQRLPAPSRPDALVADLRLGPGLDGGTEAALLQHSWQAAVPVLWVSGETTADGLRARLPVGATVLTKPVSPARLRAWLEQSLPERGETTGA
jgi:two-component system, sensor histidine kinase